jgi:hypothetical protein
VRWAEAPVLWASPVRKALGHSRPEGGPRGRWAARSSGGTLAVVHIQASRQVEVKTERGSPCPPSRRSACAGGERVGTYRPGVSQRCPYISHSGLILPRDPHPGAGARPSRGARAGPVTAPSGLPWRLAPGAARHPGPGVRARAAGRSARARADRRVRPPCAQRRTCCDRSWGDETSVPLGTEMALSPAHVASELEVGVGAGEGRPEEAVREYPGLLVDRFYRLCRMRPSSNGGSVGSATGWPAPAPGPPYGMGQAAEDLGVAASRGDGTRTRTSGYRARNASPLPKNSGAPRNPIRSAPPLRIRSRSRGVLPLPPHLSHQAMP